MRYLLLIFFTMSLFAQGNLNDTERKDLEILLLRVESTDRAIKIAESGLNDVKKENNLYRQQLNELTFKICKNYSLEPAQCGIDFKTGNVTKKETK